MAVQPWTGVRRVAFIPVSNGEVDTTLPPGFQEQVYRRAFIDPDPATGADRSLRAYIHAVSSGNAALSGQVFPPVAAPDADVVSAGLKSLPSIDLPFVGQVPVHGFDFGVLVLPHSAGPHRGGFAWYPGDTVNGVSYYCRVALYTLPDFSARQSVGVWAMEALHMICRFGDLYYSSPPLGGFDTMSCACGTHPSAYTKTRFGWADPAATAAHGIGSTKEYALVAVSHPQPPPPGRTLAVRIPSQVDSSYFVVEARLRSDLYDGPSAASTGIPAEGVVVYQVRSTTDVELRSSGLGAGDSYQSAAEDLAIRVEAAVAGGFRVRVASRASVQCQKLRAQADFLQQALEDEEDINVRKKMLSELGKLRRRIRALGCGELTVLGDLDEEAHGRFIGPRLDAAAAPESGRSRPDDA